MALSIYLTIAQSGAINAHEHIGRLYEFGRGVPQSYAEAIKWYDAGRFMLDRNTAYRLGSLCEEGTVTPRDVAQARRFFEASRTPQATYRLGASYAQEPSPLQDLPKALAWLLVAKHKGDARAESLIARVSARLSPAERASAAAGANFWIELDEE